MVFFRNVQVRYMPIQGDTRLTIALERPGASGDAGVYAGRVELAGITPRFPLPDLSAEYRMAQKWGYVEAAGIVRRIKWDDLSGRPRRPLRRARPAGASTSSSNIKPAHERRRAASVRVRRGHRELHERAPADIGDRS